jgi:hypothetical protein
MQSQRVMWILYGIIGTLGVVSCCLLAVLAAVWLRTPTAVTEPASIPPVVATTAPAPASNDDCRAQVTQWAGMVQEVATMAMQVSDAMLTNDTERGTAIAEQAYTALADIAPPTCDSEVVTWHWEFQDVFVEFGAGFAALAVGDIDTAVVIFDEANQRLEALTGQLEEIVARYQ